jgi:hypothetical protein
MSRYKTWYDRLSESEKKALHERQYENKKRKRESKRDEILEMVGPALRWTHEINLQSSGTNHPSWLSKEYEDKLRAYRMSLLQEGS